MYVKDYKYKHSTVDCGDHLEIENISRDDYVSSQYMKNIVLDRPTAVLYAGGFNIHQSESRDPNSANSRYKGTVPVQNSSMVIKESTAYAMHRWIGNMENNSFVKYANINSNTCASSMHSLYEAQQLLDTGIVEEVIIIAEERTSFNTIRIFKEHNIRVIPADGFAMIRLTNDISNVKITDCKWSYEYNRNPFGTTKSGYAAVNSSAHVVKPHGTGTDNNTIAEEDLLEDKIVVNYKDTIGHTQGVSALLELCMIIDSGHNDVLCVASGLGGFYGSCKVIKDEIQK